MWVPEFWVLFGAVLAVLTTWVLVVLLIGSFCGFNDLADDQEDIEP